MKENTVPICPGAELAFSTGAEMSWCRTVLFPSVAAVFWYHFPRTNDYNRSLLGNYIFIVAQRSLRCPYTLLLIELPTPVILLKLMTTPHDQNRDIFWNILVLDSTCHILLLVSCIEIEKFLLICFNDSQLGFCLNWNTFIAIFASSNFSHANCWVSGCCLTPTQQFFSYIMARTS